MSLDDLFEAHLFAREISQEHLVDSREEALNLASASWNGWPGKLERDLEAGGHLFEMDAGKITAVIGIEPLWNATDVPARVFFVPNCTAKHEGRVQRGRSLESDQIASHTATVVIENNAQPGFRRFPLVIQQLDVE
jgi:hypothetical protein